MFCVGRLVVIHKLWVWRPLSSRPGLFGCRSKSRGCRLNLRPVACTPALSMTTVLLQLQFPLVALYKCYMTLPLCAFIFVCFCNRRVCLCYWQERSKVWKCAVLWCTYTRPMYVYSHCHFTNNNNSNCNNNSRACRFSQRGNVCKHCRPVPLCAHHGQNVGLSEQVSLPSQPHDMFSR